LEILKCCLQLFINLRKEYSVTQTSQSSYVLEIRPLWQVIWMRSIGISAPQFSTHYTPDCRGDVLDVVVRQNVRPSEVTVTDTLDSDHLPIMFSILEPVRTRKALDPVENLIHWELFQTLASELVHQISKFILLLKMIRPTVTCSLHSFGVQAID
jgi:hypothetical protein